MKQYKSKDFIKRPIEHDTIQWVSTDKLITITTTTNVYSQYFVYVNNPVGMEWIGVSEDALDEAINKLNEMIKSEEIEKYL